MNEPTEGRILLVGEGNFSLSASLLQGGVSSGPQMIATCRESFTAVQENHQLAASNIGFLEKAGATVLFEVDATDLHNHTDINFYHFERVIFNFPLADRHNIKKNRELLSDFFSSVKNILDPDKGQVMVTLCKGQGGTPADQPMRSWHNSWQVVSMAANAGFILTQIHTFNPEQFANYKSVGFRFQDKGFNTDHALTHVFEEASVVSVGSALTGRCVLPQDDRQYVVPAYVRSKHDRWSLLDKEGHPLHSLLHHLSSTLSTSLPSLLPPIPPNASPSILPKVLPGYASSLVAVPCSDVGGGGDGDSDDGGKDSDGDNDDDGDNSASNGAGDCNGCQTEDTAATGQQPDASEDHDGQSGMSSKELKDKVNRQKMAAGDGENGALSSSSRTFTHGVDRGLHQGTGPGGRVDGSGGSSFPPLDCAVYVVHPTPQPEFSSSSSSRMDHDLVEGSVEGCDLAAGSSEQTQVDSELKTNATSKTGEAKEGMQAEEGPVSPEAKRTKMDCDLASAQQGDPATQSQPPPTPPAAAGASALCHLRCSLLENLPHLQRHLAAKGRTALLASGMVYRRCPISPCQLAASHEALVLAEEGGGEEELQSQLMDTLKSVLGKDREDQLVSSKSVTAKVVKIGEAISVNVTAALSLDGCAILGHVFTLRDGDADGQNSGTRQAWGAVLYLDTILLHALRLPDVRLLWSQDRRFLNQFVTVPEGDHHAPRGKGDGFHQSSPQSPLFPTFKPISLYPVRFVHDLSFWENPKRVFEEAEFLDVVREVAGDAVTHVTLVERYDQQQQQEQGSEEGKEVGKGGGVGEGRTSRCYRLVFQSHDRALSYISSWRMQSVLRLKLAQCLGVMLR